MAKQIAQGQVTLMKYFETALVKLSQEQIIIPTTAKGDIVSLERAYTTVDVFLGTTKLAASSISVQVTSNNGCVAKVRSNNQVYLESVSATSGFFQINVTATVNSTNLSLGVFQVPFLPQTAGANAEYVRIAGDQVFKKSKSGSDFEPLNIKLVANRYNIASNFVGKWYWINASDAPIDMSNATTILNVSPNGEYFNNRNYCTFKYEVALSGGGTAADEITIAKLEDGVDNIIMILSNESHDVVSDYDGSNTVMTGASTKVTVYKGVNDVTSSCQNWSVVSNPANGIVGSMNYTTYTYTASSMSDSILAGKVAISCTYQGTSLTKDFSLAKTRKGNTGVAGVTGSVYNLTITGGTRAFMYDENGVNPVPSMSAFSCLLSRDGIEIPKADYTKTWSTIAGSLITGSGSGDNFTPTLNPSYAGGTINTSINLKIKVTATGDEVWAQIPIVINKAPKSAKSLTVSAPQIFKYAGANFTGATSPTSITINTNLVGYSGTLTYEWYSKTGSGSYQTTSIASGSSFNVLPTDGYWGTNREYTFKCVVKDTNGNSSSDEITIVKVSDGAAGNDGKDGKDGAAGKDALFVYLFGDQVFKYVGGSTNADPGSITIKSSIQNIANPSYKWFYYNSANQLTPVSATDDGRSTLVVQPTNNSYFGTRDYCTFRLEVNSIVSDEITLFKIRDGEDGEDGLSAYTVILDNETHAIACEADGTPKEGEISKASTKVIVFRGTTRLTVSNNYANPGADKFAIELGGYSGGSAFTDADSVSLMNINDNSMQIPININLEGKITATRYFTLAKIKDGANAHSVNMTVRGGSRTVIYDEDGKNPSYDIGTLTAQVYQDGELVETLDLGAPTVLEPGIALDNTHSWIDNLMPSDEIKVYANNVVAYSWTTPSKNSVLSGSGASKTFTPTVKATYDATTDYDNNISLVVRFNEYVLSETIPIAVTKVGADGSDGVSISNVVEYYAVSPNSTGITHSNITWQTDPPAMDATNKYLWNYESISYSDNRPEEKGKPRVIGVFSVDGTNGSNGKGITSIVNKYKLTTTADAPTREEDGGGAWSTTPLTTSMTNRFLWNYEVISYTTGNPTVTAATLIGTHGEKGNDGINGVDGKGGYSVVLTNENHAILTNELGNSFVGELGTVNDKATTDALAYKGTDSLTHTTETPTTGQFKVTASGSAGVNVGQSGSKVFVTSMNVDSGYIDITFNLENLKTIVKRMSLVKAKGATNGKSYFLSVSGGNGTSVTYNSNGASPQPSALGTLTGVIYENGVPLNNIVKDRNLIPHSSIGTYESSRVYDPATKIWTVTSTPGQGTVWGSGFAITRGKVLVPYGETYICSFEVKVPRAATWAVDVNNYPESGPPWSGNDHDEGGSTRKNSTWTIEPNVWTKCWFSYRNTNPGNTGKVALVDNSNFGIRMDNETTDMIYEVRNIKGELNTIPTTYSPAPEDATFTWSLANGSATSMINSTPPTNNPSWENIQVTSTFDASRGNNTILLTANYNGVTMVERIPVSFSRAGANGATPEVWSVVITNSTYNGIQYAADGTVPSPATTTDMPFTATVYKSGVPTTAGFTYEWSLGGNIKQGTGGTTGATFNVRPLDTYVSDSTAANTFVKLEIKSGTTILANIVRPIIVTKHPGGLDWINDWNNNTVLIGTNKVVSPKIFAGTYANNLANGVALGRDILGGNNNQLGLVGYKNNLPMFKLGTDGTFFVGSQVDGGMSGIVNGTHPGLAFQNDNIYLTGNVRMTGGFISSASKLDSSSGSTLGTIASNASLVGNKLDTSVFNNMKIGGVNYIPNSSVEKTSRNEFLRYADIAPVIDKYGLVEYTISFDLKSAVAGSIDVYCQNGSNYKYNIGTTAINATTEYKRYSVTVTPRASGHATNESWLAFYGVYGTGRLPFVKNVKMELGNKATDWSAAPQDTDAKITDSINSIVIGGNNLIKNTKDMTSMNQGTTETDKYLGFTVKSTPLTSNYSDLGWSDIITPEKDTWYTLSYYAKAEVNGMKTRSYFYSNVVAEGFGSQGQASSGNTTNGSDGLTLFTLTTEWKRYWVSWKTTSSVSGVKSLIGLRAQMSDNEQANLNKKVYICAPMLEKGNKATDWTPALEDVQAEIDNVQVGGRNLWIRSTSVPGWVNGTGGIGTAGAEDRASDFILVNRNKPYVFQYWGTATGDSMPHAVIFAYFDANKNYISSVDLNRDRPTYYTAVPVMPANTVYMRISARYLEHGICKFEQGNRPTDWTPAIEDTDAKIDGIQVGGRNLLRASLGDMSEYSTTVTRSGYEFSWSANSSSAGLKMHGGHIQEGKNYVLSYKFQKTSGTIKTIGGHCSHILNKLVIDGTVSSLTYMDGHGFTNLDSNVHTVEVYLTGKAASDTNVYIQPNRGDSAAQYGIKVWDIQLEEGIKATGWNPAPEDVDKKFESYTTTVDLNAKFTTEIDKILGTVSRTYITTATANANIGTAKTEAIRDATAAADGKVSTAINNLQIGARNTFKKTTYISGAWGDVGIRRDETRAPNGFLLEVRAFPRQVRLDNVITENGWWTVSGYVKASVNGHIRMDICDNSIGLDSFPVTTEWKYFSGSSNVDHQSNLYHFVDIEQLPIGDVFFKDVKVEKGNKATDWTPAPEDVEAKVDNLQIGGTNLFKNSGFTDGTKYWGFNASSNVSAVDSTASMSGKVARWTSNSNGSGPYQGRNGNKFPVGTRFSVSCYARCTSHAGSVIDVYAEGGDAGFKRVTLTEQNTWYKCEFQGTNTTEFEVFTFYTQSGAGRTYEIRDIMLEYGDKFTTWSPSPLDAIESIAGATLTANTAMTTANSAQSTANTAATTASNAANAASTAQTKANEAAENVIIAAMASSGKMILTDPTFTKGNNGIWKYDNASSSNASVERVAKQADSPSVSGWELRFRNTGSGPSPNLGGFIFGYGDTRANAEFLVKFTAKIPVGYRCNWAQNSSGDGSWGRWITPVEGTGKYQDYMYYLKCGATGSFSSAQHVHFSGPFGTTANPVDIYMSYGTAYDLTDSPRIEAQLGDLSNSVSTISSSVAALDIKADSIANRVTTTEQDIKTTDGKITGLDSRVTTAESKVTADAVIQSVNTALANGKSIGGASTTLTKDSFTVKGANFYVKSADGNTTGLQSTTAGDLILGRTLTVGSNLGANGVIDLKDSNNVLQARLNSTGLTTYRENTGVKALGLEYSALNLYNYDKNSIRLGTLTAIRMESDFTNKGVSLSHDRTAWSSLAYQSPTSDSTHNNYIYFDKYGIRDSENTAYPISVDENMAFRSSYIGFKDGYGIKNRNTDTSVFYSRNDSSETMVASPNTSGKIYLAPNGNRSATGRVDVYTDRTEIPRLRTAEIQHTTGGTTYNSTNSGTYISPPGSGSIYFRPQGNSSSTNQAYFNSAGVFFYGDVNTSYNGYIPLGNRYYMVFATFTLNLTSQNGYLTNITFPIAFSADVHAAGVIVTNASTLRDCVHALNTSKTGMDIHTYYKSSQNTTNTQFKAWAIGMV